MILTCHWCPRQISFPGSKRDLYAQLFGWSAAGGKYRCGRCSDNGGQAYAAVAAGDARLSAQQLCG